MDNKAIAKELLRLASLVLADYPKTSMAELKKAIEQVDRVAGDPHRESLVRRAEEILIQIQRSSPLNTYVNYAFMELHDQLKLARTTQVPLMKYYNRLMKALRAGTRN